MNPDGDERETPNAEETRGVAPSSEGVYRGSGGPSDPAGTNAGTNLRASLIARFRAAADAAAAAGDDVGAQVALDAIERLGGCDMSP